MRPRLTARAQLRWDHRERKFMLLSPERGLLLNPSATRIVQLCTGDHTVIEMITQVCQDFPERHCGEVSNEVMIFLFRIASRGLIEDADVDARAS